MTETLDPMAAEVDQKQLAEQLLAQAKEHGVELMGPRRAAQSTRQECPRFGCGDDRAPRLRQARLGRPGQRQTLETVPVENGLHRDCTGGDRRRSVSAGHRFLVRAADRQEATTPPGRYRRDRIVLVRKRNNHRGSVRPLPGRLWGNGLERHSFRDCGQKRSV